MAATDRPDLSRQKSVILAISSAARTVKTWQSTRAHRTSAEGVSTNVGNRGLKPEFLTIVRYADGSVVKLFDTFAEADASIQGGTEVKGPTAVFNGRDSRTLRRIVRRSLFLSGRIPFGSCIPQ